MNQTSLGFAGASTITRSIKVRTPPEAGQLPDTDFDTLWTAIFTLDPRVNREKEITFVADGGSSGGGSAGGAGNGTSAAGGNGTGSGTSGGSRRLEAMS